MPTDALRRLEKFLKCSKSKNIRDLFNWVIYYEDEGSERGHVEGWCDRRACKVKCRQFTGKTAVSIVEWVDKGSDLLRARHLSPAEQALFIYDHLDREPREENKYQQRWLV